MRTAALLGAGASADAGLPLTNALAAELVRRMNSTQAPKAEVAALNFVYGAMVNAVTERGGDPFAAVNVETMISAVRLLRDRQQHEAVPFVEWKRPVVALDVNHDQRFTIESKLADAVQEAANEEGGDSLYEVLLGIIDNRTGSGGDGGIYAAVERRLRQLLVSVLRRSTNVDYLTPLVEMSKHQAGGIDVITLNYDLTIENAASKLGIEVCRGIDVWSPGRDLKFPPADNVVNLIKLHGSVDWVLDEVPPNHRTLPQRFARVHEPGTPIPPGGPALVIGNREKLETEGSTLALMRAFEMALRRADRLVVVGYSGGDGHVNAAIRDWINADRTRTMTILDPSWPLARWEKGTFRHELNEWLGAEEPDRSQTSRLRIVRARAQQALAFALDAVPEGTPARQFSVTARALGGFVVELEVNNVGLDAAWVTFDIHDARTLKVERPDVVTSAKPGVVELAWMPSGDIVRLNVGYSDAAEADEWSITVGAQVHTGLIHEKFEDSFSNPTDSRPANP